MALSEAAGSGGALVRPQYGAKPKGKAGPRPIPAAKPMPMMSSKGGKRR